MHLNSKNILLIKVKVLKLETITRLLLIKSIVKSLITKTTIILLIAKFFAKIYFILVIIINKKVIEIKTSFLTI